MQDEEEVGHPMRDDILQMTRDAFPTPIGISDNDAESRENAGAEIRGSVASSTSETYDLPDGLMDVPQVTEVTVHTQHLGVSRLGPRSGVLSR